MQISCFFSFFPRLCLHFGSCSYSGRLVIKLWNSETHTHIFEANSTTHTLTQSNSFIWVSFTFLSFLSASFSTLVLGHYGGGGGWAVAELPHTFSWQIANSNVAALSYSCAPYFRPDFCFPPFHSSFAAELCAFGCFLNYDSIASFAVASSAVVLC